MHLNVAFRKRWGENGHYSLRTQMTAVLSSARVIQDCSNKEDMAGWAGEAVDAGTASRLGNGCMCKRSPIGQSGTAVDRTQSPTRHSSGFGRSFAGGSAVMRMKWLLRL